MKKLCSLLSLFLVLDAYALPINSLPKLGQESSAQFPLFLPNSFTTDYDFEGIVSLDNCSGSLVRFETSSDNSLAMVLTNGHCLEGGFMEPGAHVIGKSSTRRFGILSKTGSTLGQVNATKVLYATMTTTDVTLYQLGKTFSQIADQFKVSPLTLSSETGRVGVPIEVVSGFWKRGYQCSIGSVVHKLKEAGYIWEDSIKYTQPGCETIGGTSGSPVVAAGSKTILGINNTGNEDGEECTMNNPCEEDEKGNISYQKGDNYGQQTHVLYGCLTADHQIDLKLETCELPGAGK